MKLRLLPVLLALSLTANAGGIVFLCLFISSEAHVKSLKRDKTRLTNNLTVVSTVSAAAQNNTYAAAPGEYAKRPFISHSSGMQDLFGLAPSEISGPKTNMTLLVYLHGMGSSFIEPFTRPINGPLAPELIASDHNLVLLSSNYGRANTWGNEEGYSDLTQNIREVCQQYPISHIILMGTSMGGCVALSYATAAPDDIKKRIEGIVSVEGTGDLGRLYHITRAQDIKEALVAAFGATPDQRPEIYNQKSLLPNINKLPGNVKVVIVSALRDRIVPPGEQRYMVERLQQAGVNVKLIELNQEHGVVPASTYLEAFNYVK